MGQQLTGTLVGQAGGAEAPESLHSFPRRPDSGYDEAAIPSQWNSSGTSGP